MRELISIQTGILRRLTLAVILGVVAGSGAAGEEGFPERGVPEKGGAEKPRTESTGTESSGTEGEVSPSSTSSIRLTGQEALKRASAVWRRSFKKPGPEKQALVMEAIAAYRKILADYSSEPDTASLAALRAGDLCRGLAQRAEALELYEKVLTLAGPAKHGARAQLEIAHLLRRAKRPEEASKGYREVVRKFPKETNMASQALLWLGKLALQAGDRDRARGVLREFLQGYERPAKRLVQAYDLLAQTHLDAGEVKEARQVIQECRDRFAAASSSERKVDRDLVAAIAGMKSTKRIEEMPEMPKGASETETATLGAPGSEAAEKRGEGGTEGGGNE